MIDIQLPDGRIVSIETDDPQAAAAAGRKIWTNEQGAAGLNADEMRVPIMDPTRPSGQLEWFEQAAEPDAPQARPELEFGGDMGRGLQIGSQGAGRGLAELAGAPVDLTTAFLNMLPAGAELGINAFLDDQDEISLPRITNPAGGSEQIRSVAGDAFEAAGGDLIDESEMGVSERLGYNINRFGTEAIAGAGAGQAINQAARAGGGLARYTEPFANPTAKSLAVDASAGAGAGTGVTAAQEVFPDNPIAEFVAALVGGVTGARGGQVVQSPAAAVNAVERSLPDASVPGVTRRTADQAAELMQKNVSGNRQDVAEQIGGVADTAIREGDPAPTTGIASGDIGLTAMERGARTRDPVPFQESDQRLKDAAQERVTGLSDPDADPRAAQRAAEADRDTRRQAVQEPIPPAREDLAQTRAEGTARVSEAQGAREQALAEQDQRIAQTREQRAAAETAEQDVGGEVAARRGSEGPASERVAGAVDTAKGAAEARKGALYGEAEALGRDSPVDPTPFADDAKAILDDMSPLAGDDPRVNNVLRDLSRLTEDVNKKVDTGVLGPDGQPITRPGEAADLSARDLIEMLPRLSKLQDAARAASRGDSQRRVAAVGNGIKDRLREMAEAGDPAAQKWMEAEGFFKEEFAPKFREGVGGQLDQAERAKQPVPPTAVAGRFLKPGAGGKEAAADLKRILEGSNAEQAGAEAARDYVLADLSRVVGNDGKINPNRLRAWMAGREGVFEAMPELRQEVQGLLNDVVNKRGETGRLRQELDAAVAERRGIAERTQRQIKEIEADNALSEKVKQERIATLEREAAQVEKDIQSEATAILLDTDPAVAAKRVFSGKDPETAMGDIVAKLSKDPEALAGWKEAVTQHMIDRVTTTNTALTGGAADGPVSIAGLKKFFDTNERALTKLYSPDEMRALRRAHKVLEPLGNLQRTAVPGSQTKANEQAWNALEAGLLAVTGNAITTGMIMKRIRTVLKLMPNQQDNVDALVKRMWFDPQLAQHLIKRNVKTVESAAWNKRLTRLLATGEAAREMVDEDATPEEPSP